MTVHISESAASLLENWGYGVCWDDEAEEGVVVKFAHAELHDQTKNGPDVQVYETTLEPGFHCKSCGHRHTRGLPQCGNCELHGTVIRTTDEHTDVHRNVIITEEDV